MERGGGRWKEVEGCGKRWREVKGNYLAHEVLSPIYEHVNGGSLDAKEKSNALPDDKRIRNILTEKDKARRWR